MAGNLSRITQHVPLCCNLGVVMEIADYGLLFEVVPFNIAILNRQKMEGKASRLILQCHIWSKTKGWNERTCPSFRCSAASGSCPSSTSGSPGCQKRCRMDSALIGGETRVFTLFSTRGNKDCVHSQTWLAWMDLCWFSRCSRVDADFGMITFHLNLSFWETIAKKNIALLQILLFCWHGHFILFYYITLCWWFFFHLWNLAHPCCQPPIRSILTSLGSLWIQFQWINYSISSLLDFFSIHIFFYLLYCTTSFSNYVHFPNVGINKGTQFNSIQLHQHLGTGEVKNVVKLRSDCTTLLHKQQMIRQWKPLQEANKGWCYKD